MAATSLANRVVVAMLDGSRLKGYLYGFNPASETIYLYAREKEDRRHAQLVDLARAKAIFFVKTHEGNRGKRGEEPGTPRPEPAPSKVRGVRMRIHFSDGEVMDGVSEAYNPIRPGFFVFPLDLGGNNIRTFVVNRHVRKVETDPAVAAPGERTAAPAPSPPGVPPLSAPIPAETASAALPLQRKIEIVLRVLNGESLWQMASDLEVPGAVLVYWTDTFLRGGREALAMPGDPVPDSRDALIAELRARLQKYEKAERELQERLSRHRR